MWVPLTPVGATAVWLTVPVGATDVDVDALGAGLTVFVAENSTSLAISEPWTLTPATNTKSPAAILVFAAMVVVGVGVTVMA